MADMLTQLERAVDDARKTVFLAEERLKAAQADLYAYTTGFKIGDPVQHVSSVVTLVGKVTGYRDQALHPKRAALYVEWDNHTFRSHYSPELLVLAHSEPRGG